MYFSEIEIETFRNDTPGCANRIHLNNAGASLMPAPVVKAIQQQIELEANIGGYEAAEVMAAIKTVLEQRAANQSTAQLPDPKP